MPRLAHVRSLLVRAARRHSRVLDDVEDVAQDVLESGLRRGMQLEGEPFARAAFSAARRHALFLARTAGRRRARELDFRASVAEEGDADAPSATPLSVLSPVLRTTLLLLMQGLEKAKLRALLGVSDAALRKRFEALRDHAPLARPDLPEPNLDPVQRAARRGQVALLPRLANERPAPRLLAVRDPDGHGIIFAEQLTDAGGAATSRAPADSPARKPQGTPCSTAKSRTSPSSSS